MGRIILVDGQRGGVGKSIYSRFLNHYLTEKQHPYNFVDADPNPDVFEVYGGQKDIQFVVSDEQSMLVSDQASLPDKLVDLAIYQDVLVNLPGKAHDSVKFWILSNELLDSAFVEETKVSFIKFFLTNGTQDSLGLFEDSLLTYDGKIPHYLVKNMAFIADWEEVIQTETYQRIKNDHSFETLLLPALRKSELKFIIKSGKTFKAVEDDLQLLGKKRLKNFIDGASEDLERLEVFVNG